ncbi:solute carrier organic anion transporter family member [Plakobranchus ocellatus]|uniref:Solute carrier organic anion transporter family member n=1 Tax=Plakobranchus ocellatus TaxID=259542 RepID=A0AAV4DMF0_9GAST|nr:solute carrier organic anion transporter family member [Plakobranchus ocellatus]
MGLDTNNPKWVGAWWIGFLLSGTFGVLLSFPLLAFPRSLPGILVAGFSTFMPKFIEYQFGYPASTAALYVGLIVVPTGGGATVVSGYIVRRFNLKVRGILKLCTGMSAVLCLFVLAFLMECGNSPFAGITLPYGQTAAQTTAFIGKRLESGCNVDCACAEQDYFPMCGRDNVMYFSPCYAGCTEVFQDGNTKLYGNCSCVSYTLTEEDITSSRTHMGEFGKCHYSCSWFKYFMVLFGIMIVLIFGVSMPSLTATLRCIPDHQRSFGLGIQWIVARCLGRYRIVNVHI